MAAQRKFGQFQIVQIHKEMDDNVPSMNFQNTFLGKTLHFWT